MFETSEENAKLAARRFVNIFIGNDEKYPTIAEYLANCVGNLNDSITNGSVQFVTQKYGRGYYNIGVVVQIAGNGPTIWLNTADGMVYATGDDEGVYGCALDSDIVDYINTLFGVVEI